MALKQIKSKIKATQRTGKVTKAMEAVSAVKMRKSQERAMSGRSFAEAAFRVLDNISQSLDVQRHPYLISENGNHECLIVITADKGLAGSLNSSVLKESMNVLTNLKKEDVEIICFGKKAYEHFTHRHYTVSRQYVNINDDINLSDMKEVVSFITGQFKAGKYKRVRMIYQHFVSTFEQRATVRQVLPIKTQDLQLMIRDILPKHGKFSNHEKPKFSPVYTIEQSYELLFDSIFSTLVEIMMYHALLESKASEHSARMVAMKNATDKADDVTKELTLRFNMVRQSVITAEVSEITGGIEAMNNS